MLSNCSTTFNPSLSLSEALLLEFILYTELKILQRVRSCWFCNEFSSQHGKLDSHLSLFIAFLFINWVWNLDKPILNPFLCLRKDWEPLWNSSYTSRNSIMLFSGFMFLFKCLCLWNLSRRTESNNITLYRQTS
jgi:glycosyltransferase involved in cell wall biosynthesis